MNVLPASDEKPETETIVGRIEKPRRDELAGRPITLQ